MCNNNASNKNGRRSSKQGVSRRDVIRYGVASTLGFATLGPLGKGILQEASGAPLPNHKRCVVIYCYGGYDGLQMVVPTGIQAYHDRRLSIAPLTTTLDIGKTGYELNDLLPNMHAVHSDPVRGNQLAMFQKVGYPDDDLSHFNSQDFYSWGVRNGFGGLPIPESGWIARFADAYTTDSLGACSVGVGRPLDMEGSSVNPLMVSNLTSFEFDVDGDYQANHQLRIDAVNSILAGYSPSGLDAGAQQALQQAHDLTAQIQMAVDNYTPPDPMLGETPYPTSTPGRYLQDIMRMIEAGFDTKLFFTGFGGWDNHSNLITAMGNRIGRLDDALGAFIEDCQRKNIWDDMVIIIESEFGRRIFENGSFGTDHGHGNVFFALGGGVNGGYYGPDLTVNEMENNNWLGYDIDFRDIRKEMVNDWFGGDGDAIFPEPQDINQNLGYLL